MHVFALANAVPFLGSYLRNLRYKVSGKWITKLIKLSTNFIPRTVSLHVRQPLDRGWQKAILILQRFSRQCKNQTGKLSHKEQHKKNINCPVTYSVLTPWYQTFFFIHFMELLPPVLTETDKYSLYALCLRNWYKRAAKVWKEKADICG